MKNAFNNLSCNFYKLIGSIFLVSLSSSCAKDPFPSFRTYADHIFYKLISFEAENKLTSENNYVEIDYSKNYFYKDSSAILRNFWANLNDFSKNSEVLNIVSKSSIGDSISIIVPNHLFIFSPIKDTSLVVVNFENS